MSKEVERGKNIAPKAKAYIRRRVSLDIGSMKLWDRLAVVEAIYIAYQEGKDSKFEKQVEPIEQEEYETI